MTSESCLHVEINVYHCARTALFVNNVGPVANYAFKIHILLMNLIVLPYNYTIPVCPVTVYYNVYTSVEVSVTAWPNFSDY